MVIHRHALTSIREARGLTKKQFCELADISPSYLTELESGDKPGSPQIAKRLADALAVNPLALLNPAVTEKTVDEIKAQVA